MTIFNIGDEVVIREDSQYYNRSSDIDPDNSVIGTVIDIDSKMDYEGEICPIRVKWRDCTNIYREEDLEFVKDVNIEDWV